MLDDRMGLSISYKLKNLTKQHVDLVPKTFLCICLVCVILESQEMMIITMMMMMMMCVCVCVFGFIML